MRLFYLPSHLPYFLVFWLLAFLPLAQADSEQYSTTAKLFGLGLVIDKPRTKGVGEQLDILEKLIQSSYLHYADIGPTEQDYQDARARIQRKSIEKRAETTKFLKERLRQASLSKAEWLA